MIGQRPVSGKVVPAKTHDPDRRCKDCNKPMSRYNEGTRCYSCADAKTAKTVGIAARTTDLASTRVASADSQKTSRRARRRSSEPVELWNQGRVEGPLT